MKYSPGNKKIRRSKWTTTTAPLMSNRNEAHQWCRDYPSDGKFYHHYTNTRWWFENEKDAIAFQLWVK